jgi:NADP-dependent aldehyde dehydrogenase
LLRVDADRFLSDPAVFQTEAFGNASLVVVAKDAAQIVSVVHALEGNLTGTIYSSESGADDADYTPIADALAGRVGRLLNDKMPTGVAVSSAMNHGGPFPATGHPGFTAVGIPASLLRFGKLTCFDAVRESRLPALLRGPNPTGQTWRLIDGQWSTKDVG